jgi:MATE family multidrug resistance protein
MLGESALGLVDTRLVGRLGAAALAGVGTATVLFFLVASISIGLMRGVKVRASYAIGEERPQDAVRYAQAGVIAGLLFGIMMFALTRNPEPMLRGLGVDPITAVSAAAFVRARGFGAPALCVISAMVQYRQAVGDARSAMIAGLGANILNAALGYTLIYGLVGMPRLGVAGAGYATAIAEWVEALGLLLYALHLNANNTQRSTLSLRVALREVAVLGVPTGAHFFAENLAFATFTLVIGSMGAAEMAANQLAFNAIRVSFLPGFAVSEAACVLVGQALGRRDQAQADRVTVMALALAMGFMALCGVVFVFCGSAIARFFSDDPHVVRVAAKLLAVAALFQALDAASMVLRGVLRAAKEVRYVAVVGTCVAWVCIPGAAWLLGQRLGWGAVGGWWGFVAETSVVSVLLWRRWSRGSWRKSLGLQPPPAEPAPRNPLTDALKLA